MCSELQTEPTGQGFSPEQGLASCTACLHVAERNLMPIIPDDGQATSASLCPARPVTMSWPGSLQLCRGFMVWSRELIPQPLGCLFCCRAYSRTRALQNLIPCWPLCSQVPEHPLAASSAAETDQQLSCRSQEQKGHILPADVQHKSRKSPCLSATSSGCAESSRTCCICCFALHQLCVYEVCPAVYRILHSSGYNISICSLLCCRAHSEACRA